MLEIYYATSIKPRCARMNWRHIWRSCLLQAGQPQDILLCRLLRTALAQGFTYVDTVPDFKLTSTGYDFSAYSQAIKIQLPRLHYANNFIPLADVNQTGANILNFYQKYASPNRPGQTTANKFPV